MNIKKNQFNTNTKILLFVLFLWTALVFLFALFTINGIQNKIYKNYADFAGIIVKSVETRIFGAQNSNDSINFSVIDSRFDDILKENSEIAFIEFKDKNNITIYSSDKTSPGILTLTSPVSPSGEISGYLTVGLNGFGIKNIIYNAKKTIIVDFSLLWLIFSIIITINYAFLTAEMKKLYKAVKQISTGRFGYKLESDNMGKLTDAFNNMSKILSKYEEKNIEQLTLERNKLEAVLMSIINGVIVCDNFDNVVLANSAALSMLDIKEENFIETKIQDYTDSHGEKCFLEKIEEFKDTPLDIIETKQTEFNIEAEKRTFKAMISPMFSKQQDYVGYIIVLIDITRETEVNKLKNTFISNVSHELRTPVTVLRSYIDTLCHNGEDFDEETKKEFLNTIDTEAKRLHSMVNDILDFSRLESGNISLKKEFINLVQTIEQNINSIKILADEKNINITFDKEENLPFVPVNSESIDRVIRNLLSNAIKYSPDGKDINVYAGLSEDKKYFKLSVKDNGIGIAKEHLEKIFDRFYRVENATHTVKGTGLGLHLVKMTVENHHHGTVTVTSEEGKGSIFTVLLPLNVEDSELA